MNHVLSFHQVMPRPAARIKPRPINSTTMNKVSGGRGGGGSAEFLRRLYKYKYVLLNRVNTV